MFQLKMSYLSDTFIVLVTTFYFVNCQTCDVKCPEGDEEMQCGFDAETTKYRMFPSQCAMDAYKECYKQVYIKTTLEFCVKYHNIQSRKVYGESCPVFCPSHYRPVCGASKFRDYMYRSFTNGCHLDMLNCRGEDEMFGYVEVPLEFCQRHGMKNIFKEQIVYSNVHDYRDYH